MTSANVLRTHHDIFYRALLHREWNVLADLYADNSSLIRSNGTVLLKEAVLKDMRAEDPVSRSIQLTNIPVRLVGSVARVTGESRTVTEREGMVSKSHFRLVAVYVEDEGRLRLLHSRNTDRPAIQLPELANERNM